MCLRAFHSVAHFLDQNKASVLRQLMKTADEAGKCLLLAPWGRKNTGFKQTHEHACTNTITDGQELISSYG